MESDQSDLDVIMVGHWMLCGVGSSLIWTLDVLTVGPWMLSVVEWSRSLSRTLDVIMVATF